MKKIISICTIIMLCLGILAGCGQKSQEETVVKLVFDEETIEVTTSRWEEKTVQISTEDIGLGDGKVYDFVGVKLSDLMEMAGADECGKAIVHASDNHSSEVSAEDIKNYDIVLVNSHVDGKPISKDAGGPVKLVFPVTDHPELKDRYETWSWMWYVYEIEFVK